MNLKIQLPFQIFAEESGVLRIVAETREGAFGILPQRRDCAAALAAGIFTYETTQDGPVYLAVDEGVLVKVGPDVLVSVRNAIRGTSLSQLHETVKREFLTFGEQERDVRAAISRMEGSFIRQFVAFQHGG